MIHQARSVCVDTLILMWEKVALVWDRAKGVSRLTYSVLEAAARSYGLDRVNRMAAAVAYRTMFALTPFLLIALFTLGIFLGNASDAQQQILDFIEGLAGSVVAGALETLASSIVDTSGTAGLVGFALLLWTGSSLFLELQNDLNDIFGVPYEQTAGVAQTVIKRLIGFGWALSIGVIVGAVWLLNSVWQLLGDLFPASFAPVHTLITILTPVVSLVVMPFVFALVFQTLTKVRVRWRAVWWGSFFTSLAFLLTAYGAGIYFRLSSKNAATLAAALFVILLVAYLLSAVFLVGAEVTKVYDRYLRTGVVTAHEDPEPPQAIVGQPEPAMAMSTLAGFLAGMFVGWRRKG